MDYRDLLKRYMGHVLSEEGTYFVPHENTYGFSDEDRRELRAIADEITIENDRRAGASLNARIQQP
jgi:hypothetical protein